MRAPVAQVVVHPTSKQEVRGSIPETGTNGNFLSTYFNRGSGGSEPTLNCRSHHKELSNLREKAPCRGINYLGGSG